MPQPGGLRVGDPFRRIPDAENLQLGAVIDLQIQLPIPLFRAEILPDDRKAQFVYIEIPPLVCPLYSVFVSTIFELAFINVQVKCQNS